jgi:hypothetical protein
MMSIGTIRPATDPEDKPRSAVAPPAIHAAPGAPHLPLGRGIRQAARTRRDRKAPDDQVNEGTRDRREEHPTARLNVSTGQVAGQWKP